MTTKSIHAARFYRVGLGPPAPDPGTKEQRALALSVPCPYNGCSAGPGVFCGSDPMTEDQIRDALLLAGRTIEAGMRDRTLIQWTIDTMEIGCSEATLDQARQRLRSIGAKVATERRTT